MIRPPIKIAPPEPDLPNIRKHLGTARPLWRLCVWGGVAAIALTAVALTSRTEAGSRRLQLALAYVSEPVRAVAVAQIPPRAVETDAETRRLTAQVRELAADRDRLTARLASLERNLDDMTGSIKRQAATAAATPAANTPAPAPSPPITAPPAIAPPATVPPATVPPAIAPLAMPAGNDAAAAWPDTPPTESSAPAADAVPLPPVRVAAAPASEPAAEPPPPAKPEFGIDLGGAANVEVLRAQWAAVKANYGPLLAGLHPIAAHDRRPGSTAYRLVAGPLPNFTAARALCSRFAAMRAGCQPAKFDGERIALH